jgi:photosystem II stability/assembly factor-like uncharacterized protein
MNHYQRIKTEVVSSLTLDECDDLRRFLETRCQDLRNEVPSYEVAIEAGIQDNSYSAPEQGRILSYSGTVTCTGAGGTKWVCTGHTPLLSKSGNVVTRNGYISFRKLEE